MLVGRGVDALVLAPSDDLSPELADYLRRVRTPVLLLDRELPTLPTDTVLVDHAPGIRSALEMLDAGGKRRIGVLTRDHQTRAGRAIIDAWAAESARLGIEPDASLVAMFDDLDREAGRAGVDQLLDAGADAIVSTGTMEHTASVLGRLAERSVRVPADVSLVAYGYLVPPIREHIGLPTIVYPVEQVATATQELLHRRLADRAAAPRSLWSRRCSSTRPRQRPPESAQMNSQTLMPRVLISFAASASCLSPLENAARRPFTSPCCAARTIVAMNGRP